MEEPISRASLKAEAAARAVTPVFLDDTGRRARRLRAATSVGALAVALTFGAVFAAMSGAPTVISPMLPAPAQTSEVDASDQRPAVAPTPVSAPSVDPRSEPAPSESSPPVVEPVTTQTPAPAPAPSPSATAEPAETPGKSGAAPGRSKTPPARP